MKEVLLVNTEGKKSLTAHSGIRDYWYICYLQGKFSSILIILKQIATAALGQISLIYIVLKDGSKYYIICK